MPRYLKRILNKCHCGEVCDCVIIGNSRKGKPDNGIEVIGYNCTHCGIKKPVDLKEAEL